MDTSYSQEEFDAEYNQYRRSAQWELNNIQKALNMLPFLNTSDSWARLAAVKQIKRERAAAKRAAR